MSRYSVSITLHRGGALAPITTRLEAVSAKAAIVIAQAAATGADARLTNLGLMQRMLPKCEVHQFAGGWSLPTPNGGRLVIDLTKVMS